MQRVIEQLADKTFDIVVVGAGMHGAWIALRAARAGYRVALLEKDDFGASTSANSLRILHGGLRYLQHLNFDRMRGSIRARREFARLAPHLVAPLPCVMPLRWTGVRSPWILGPALLANNLLSWDRNLGVTAAARLPAGWLLRASRCKDLIAPLAEIEPAAGALWWDATVLDAERLTLETVLAAAEAGAAIANRVEARSLVIERHSIAGVVATDRLSGATFTLACRALIDATGPWGGQLSAASGLENEFPRSAWVGAMNLVLRRRCELNVAVALSSASKSGDSSAIVRRQTRELFFVPRGPALVVGTDYYEVDPLGKNAAAGLGSALATPSAQVVQQFLEEARRVAPAARLSSEDLLRVEWGLLPAEGAMQPRKSPILLSGREQTGVAGLTVVVGEKLTSAPELSAQVLNFAAPRASPAPGAYPSANPAHPGAYSGAYSGDVVGRLKLRYGPRWPQVALHGRDTPDLLERIHPTVPALGVELVHAIREEMALDLDDLVRRLGFAESEPPSEDLLQRCNELAAQHCNWRPAPSAGSGVTHVRA